MSSIVLLTGTSQRVNAQAPPCCEKYYVLVFGSQQLPPDPRYSHSFGIFVKVTEFPNQQRVLEHHSISWLAANLKVRLWAFLPEPGVNLGIHPTLNWAYGTCQRVSLWGPYEIDRDLYCRSVKQFNLLQSGQVKYKAVDTGYPTSRVSNCIHALGSVAGGYRMRVTSPAWGETASYAVMMRYRKWIINENQKHMWLIPALGLGQYPIVYRDLEPPRSAAGWMMLRRLLGLPLDNTSPMVFPTLVDPTVVPPAQVAPILVPPTNVNPTVAPGK